MFLQNLKTSVDSLTVETAYLQSLITKNQYSYIFSTPLLEHDFDYKSFVKLYNAIKAYAQQIPDTNNEFLKDKLNELPPISEEEFKLYNFSLGSSYLLYFLLPIGISVWTMRYFKLSALQHKVHGISRTLGTAEFILKALLN